jgi:hypothetical protein
MILRFFSREVICHVILCPNRSSYGHSLLGCKVFELFRHELIFNRNLLLLYINEVGRNFCETFFAINQPTRRRIHKTLIEHSRSYRYQILSTKLSAREK